MESAGQDERSLRVEGFKFRVISFVIRHKYAARNSSAAYLRHKGELADGFEIEVSPQKKEAFMTRLF